LLHLRREKLALKTHAIHTQVKLLINSFDEALKKDEKLVNYFMMVLSGINLHLFYLSLSSSLATDTDKISSLTFRSIQLDDEPISLVNIPLCDAFFLSLRILRDRNFQKARELVFFWGF
jgi:hypothetical protein